MRNLPPNMAPFDVPAPPPRQSPIFQDPPVSLRRSTHPTPDNDRDPTLKMHRDNLAGDNHHADEPAWNFMAKMEFLDPWNLRKTHGIYQT